MKKILLVEDESVALEDLRDSLLDIIPDARITGARSATEALDVLARESYDAIFLDIDLPGMSGIQLLERIPPPVPPVVIVTAHALLALDAFGLGVVECLLKPVDQQRLRRAVQRISAGNVAASAPTPHAPPPAYDMETRVFARNNGRIWPVRVGDIWRIEEEEQTARLYFRGENALLAGDLQVFATLLDPRLFVRAGPTTIINVAMVDHFQRSPGAQVVAYYPDGQQITFDAESSREFGASHGL